MGDEVLLNGNNYITPAAIINISSFVMKGKQHSKLFNNSHRCHLLTMYKDKFCNHIFHDYHSYFPIIIELKRNLMWYSTAFGTHKELKYSLHSRCLYPCDK